jgi:NADPH:quinone reductase-like Zn-dependent oxidoreductase
VGSIAVQLAKWKGAHVIGTASGRNQGLLRELGVDEPIDYEKTRFEDVVHDAEVVLDTLGGDTQNRSWKVLKKGRDSGPDCCSAVGRGTPVLHSCVKSQNSSMQGN